LPLEANFCRHIRQFASRKRFVWRDGSCYDRIFTYLLVDYRNAQTDRWNDRPT